MAKENTTKEFLTLNAENPYRGEEGTDFIRCTIDVGFADTKVTGADGKVYDGQKAEIFWPIPKTDEQAKKFFGAEASLAELVKAGVRQLSTRPNYKAGCDGKSFEEAVAWAQDMAQNYEIGRKATVGGGMKQKAAKLNAIDEQAKALGFANIDDMIAAFKEQKG